MRKLTSAFLIVLVFFSFSFANGGNDDKNNAEKKRSITTCSLTGSVIDKESNEKLVCARIEVEGTEISVFTDILGNFEIPALSPGTYNLKVTYISYEEKLIAGLVVKTEKDLTIDLKPL